MTKSKFNLILHNIDFNTIKVNKGIYEFPIKDNITLGVSYEKLDEFLTNMYIFNLFVDKEYINICGEYENPFEAIDILFEEYQKYVKSE